MTKLTPQQRTLLLVLVLLQSTIAPLVLTGLVPNNMDRFMELFDAGRGAIGTVEAAMMLLSAVFAFAAGFLAERIGNLRVLLVAIAAQSVPIALFAFVGGPWSAALLAFVFYSGMNMTCVANAISTEFFRSSRKRGVNLLHGVNSLGKWMGPVVALVFAGALWRWGFAAVGVYGAGILVLGVVVVAMGVRSHEPAALQDEPVLNRPL